MNITTKYDIGQKVWTIRLVPAKQVVCPLCGGAKDLSDLVNKEGQAGTVEKKIMCPRCQGKGHVLEWYKYVPEKWEVISIEYAGYKNISYKLTPEGEEEFTEGDIVFLESSVYGTEEEAQTAADAYNKDLR